MYVGFTYWDKHPWFVCTRPDRDDEVVVINATGWVSDFPDMTCILEAGVHPAITKKSVMFYQEAEFKKASNFAGLIKARIWTPDADAPDDLIERIRKGALDSEFTPEEQREAVSLCRWKPGLSRT